MELLAPAGTDKALVAAVQSGADAVYIGGEMFSARRVAENFSDENMKQWIDYCHIRDVDVHVAANTLIKEKEIDSFVEYIKKINKNGADALIIQDIGMASYVKMIFPDLPLHASTQMTAASLDAVKYLENMGFSRVVLARELSKKEIEHICKYAKAEIEVFVHGALCMCYSGQCIMSSMIGGRSGNRGLCAQPCRLAYDMINKEKVVAGGYLLSPKDNALIDEIKTLKNIGVTSLKIEGRLKRPEYVAQVTSVYREIIDSNKIPEKLDWDVLKNAFNRSGFTKGYFLNKHGRNMMSFENPGNISNNKFTEEAIKRSNIDTNIRKTAINIYAKIKNNKKAEITLTDEKYNSVTAYGDIYVSNAEKKPLTKELIKRQLLKLGNTPFYTENIEIEIDDNVSLPLSEINNIRRKATAMLEREKSTILQRRINNIKPSTICKANEHYSDFFSAEIRNMQQVDAVLKYDIPILYVPEYMVQKVKKLAPERKIITILPPIWKENKIQEYRVIDGVQISNIGQLNKFSEFECYGGARLNIFNSKSVEHFKNMKILHISPELNLKEIEILQKYTLIEVLVYGRLPLMVMENCPIKTNYKCGESVCLRDRKKEIFPLLCAPGCYCELFNSKPVYMADKFNDLKKLHVNAYKLNFTTESARECETIIEEYINAMAGKKIDCYFPENSFTRGHYYRGVE